MKRASNQSSTKQGQPIQKQSKFDTKKYERPGLSHDQIIQIKQSFDLFDTDQSGLINPRDLKASLDTLGFQAQNQTIYQMITDLDADGSGNINFEQFLHLMTQKITQKDSKQNINKVFQLLDDDKTGFISISTLRRVVKQLGQNIDQQQLQYMIDRADTDRDGMVTQDDFYMIITKKYATTY